MNGFGFGQFQSPYTFNSGNDFPSNTGSGASKSFYVLGGGTIGGRGLWDKNMQLRPEAQAASRAMGKKGIRVLPSGAGSRQELRYMREQAEREGYDWTEAPTKYTQGTGPTSPRNKNQPLDPTGYYDPQGRKFTGTQMWVGGGYGERMEREVPSPQPPSGINQAPSLTQATELRETELGTTGQPLAFTGFGQMAREQKADQYQTPVGRGLSASGMQIPSTGFGDVSLRFPFAGAESAFERTTRTTNTFGGLPMFPSSRFGGPQPAETMGPVETQPRRSWMY